MSLVEQAKRMYYSEYEDDGPGKKKKKKNGQQAQKTNQPNNKVTPVAKPSTQAASTDEKNKQVEAPKKTYSDYSNPPKEQAGEFPGDYSDRLTEWEKNLSPEDKMKLRSQRAKDANINLDQKK